MGFAFCGSLRSKKICLTLGFWRHVLYSGLVNKNVKVAVILWHVTLVRYVDYAVVMA
jgi:hypothetical protein